jgi:molybdate/tungstate transport system ATP-binding protein
MIEIKNLSINLGEFFLKDVNLTIEDKEYFVVLGPTGAGKTVLVECIAGLHHIRKGGIWRDNIEITRLTPEERNLSYVPQDYVLFPFLNVFDNIAFGLKQRRYPKADIQERVKTIVELLGITDLLNRDVRTLSGGEKQRVALSRALAPFPSILLLDEPLCALDLQTAKHLRRELQRIHRELGITTIHITHDQKEAEEIADRIAVLNLGRIEQMGSPEEIFFYPQNEAVSDFIGRPNILDCDDCRILAYGLLEVSCHGTKIILPYDGSTIKRIALFPRDIFVSIAEPPGMPVNLFKGTITDIKYYQGTASFKFKVGENTLQGEIARLVAEEMDLEVGKEIFVKLDMRRIRAFGGNFSRNQRK